MIKCALSTNYNSNNQDTWVVLWDITSDLMDEMSPNHNWWLFICQRWMLLLLSSWPPMRIWPTQHVANTSCNLRPFRQWGDATPPISIKEPIIFREAFTMVVYEMSYAKMLTLITQHFHHTLFFLANHTSMFSQALATHLWQIVHLIGRQQRGKFFAIFWQ